VELYLHYPNMPSWRGAQLKRRHNFTQADGRGSGLCPMRSLDVSGVEAWGSTVTVLFMCIEVSLR
jgi:hypothetical protein